jgi:hypothetical protein
MKNLLITTPEIDPMGLKDCARLSLRVAVFSSPIAMM